MSGGNRPTEDFIASLTSGDIVYATFQPLVTDDLIPEARDWVGVPSIYRVIGPHYNEPKMLVPEYNENFYGFRAPLSDFIDVERE